MNKPVSEQTFREQIGAAAKYGAYSPTFLRLGFRAPWLGGHSDTLTPRALQDCVDEFSERDVRPATEVLLAKQPSTPLLDGWSPLDLLKLRAYLALRLGDLRYVSEGEKDLALVRSYPVQHSLRGGVDESPYRDNGPGRQLTRRDRSVLLDQIADEVQRRRTPVSAAGEIERVKDQPGVNVIDASGEDFVIEFASDLYTFPSSTGEKLQILKEATIRALRDGVTEYRYTVELTSRGGSKPKPKVLGGPEVRLERVETISRAGIPGYAYQAVIQFSTPMMKADEPRHFSWRELRSVSHDFFEGGLPISKVGFLPNRETREARVAVQFAPGTGPDRVTVRTNVPVERMDLFDPAGETKLVIDDYVEMTWHDLRVGRYCTLVWPR